MTNLEQLKELKDLTFLSVLQTLEDMKQYISSDSSVGKDLRKQIQSAKQVLADIEKENENN